MKQAGADDRDLGHGECRGCGRTVRGATRIYGSTMTGTPGTRQPGRDDGCLLAIRRGPMGRNGQPDAVARFSHGLLCVAGAGMPGGLISGRNTGEVGS